MKRILTVVSMLLVMVVMCLGVFSGSANDVVDPSEIYTPITAPNEDSSISLWFEHSFKKIMTSDTTPSGMDTYSVYMAKNEIENAQFVLYSDELKESLSASVTSFKDANGNEISAELYYQAYVTLTDLDTLGYQGATAENTFIREGEQPDPLIPMSVLTMDKTYKLPRFQLNAGKSQAFYIRLKSTEDTPSGWYSATLNILDVDNNIVKTATVYAYVWDFVIEEETALQTSFYIDNNTTYGGSYQAFYDYLLENRILGMDIPGNLKSYNSYLTNDRVNAIRVSNSGGGNVSIYKDALGAYPDYIDIYNDLSSMKEWDDIKDKFYFYTIDEAMSYEQQYAINGNSEVGMGSTVDDVIAAYEYLKNYWPDAAEVVPYHENHPYPYNVYDTTTMASLLSSNPSQLKDGMQAMIDSKSINIWCPQIYAFTPQSELYAINYRGNGNEDMRNLSCTISGSIRAGERYFDWEGYFGEFKDRAISSNIVRNRTEYPNNVMWTYSAGWNKSYTYCNHLIESSGLQTKMLFWQLYQEDITGYLYYGTNNWHEYDSSNGGYVDSTVTGSNTKTNWKNNKHPYPATGYSIYGNGTLFYGATQFPTKKVDYIGTIRVEQMRDGIEEYQMLTMLEELKGEEAAKSIVNSVSNSVVRYLSLPGFDRSAFSSDMDDYDIMAAKRIELGNAVEAASANVCNHIYDDGVVTKPATCKELGETTYTCKKCGADKIEFIPALHSDVANLTETVITATSCTADGKSRYTCEICGYQTEKTYTAYHNDEAYLTYSNTGKYGHTVICTLCNAEIKNESHHQFAEYTNTCTEAGVHNNTCVKCGYYEYVEDVAAKGHYILTETVAATCTEPGYTGGACQNCDYVEEVTEIPVIPHNYVNGVCTVCGGVDETYEPPVVGYAKGDINNDDSVNLRDMFSLKKFIAFADTPDELERAAADVNGDGLVNVLDSFELSYRITNGSWRE